MNRNGRAAMHLYLLIAVLVIATKCGVNASLLNRPPSPALIDALRRDYLNVEKTLWNFIDNRQSELDKVYLLEQIHIRHSAFLNSDFRLKNLPLSYFETRHTSLLDAIHTVNAAADDLVKNHLHSDSSRLSQDESLQSARQQSHLVKEIDIIYNATGLSDFFTEIRNVSACAIYSLGVVNGLHTVNISRNFTLTVSYHSSGTNSFCKLNG